MAKNEVRFAVGEPNGLRSSVWKIWATGSDVYVQSKTMAKSTKISLHQSGICQWSALTEYASESELFRGKSRHIGRWKRNEPVGLRLSHLFSIIIPGSELRDVSDVTKRLIEWLPNPGIDHKVVVSIYISNSLPTLISVEMEAKPLFLFQLRDKRIVLGLARTEKMESQLLEQLESVRVHFSKQMGLKIPKGCSGVARMEDAGGVGAVMEFIPH